MTPDQRQGQDAPGEQNRRMMRYIYETKREENTLMTDASTVNILAGLTTVVNLILYALIVFLVVMLIKKIDSRTDKTENHTRRKDT